MTNGPGRLPDAALDALETALAPVDGWIAARRAPASADGRPGHTVLVAADRAEPGVCAAWGRAALEALDEHAPGPVSLAMATGLPADEVETAWPELRRRLGRRPVEDLRIDLSAAGAGSAGDEGRATPAPGGPVAGVAAVPDGGAADDAAADDAADQAVRTLLAEVDDAGGPVRCGVLHRGLGASTRHLAVRALDRVVGGLAEAGGPPAGFRLTLPGAVHVDQVAAYSALLRVLEVVHDLPEDRLVFELRVDAPEAVLAADGTVPLRAMVDAAGTRCVGLHLDAVGYGAALGLPGAGGGARHVDRAAQDTDGAGIGHGPSRDAHADHDAVRTAAAVVRLAGAAAGIEVADGASVAPAGDDRAAVHAHWRAHAGRALTDRADGVPQGWDVDPLQLVTRHLVALVAADRGPAAS